MNKINLSNKEKVKDGLSLLREAVNFITTNNLERIETVIDSSYLTSYHFICSRGKYLELEKYILSKYSGKFYRDSDDPYYSKDDIPDYVDSLFLYIKNDKIRNPRVCLHHFYKEKDRFERLEIKISTWVSFMKSNLFEDEIISLINKLSYEKINLESLIYGNKCNEEKCSWSTKYEVGVNSNAVIK